MSDPTRMARCYVHYGQQVDVRLMHRHHKHPQGYGGSVDDPANLLWLCGSCHDVVHKLAQYKRSNKKGLVYDLSRQYQADRNMSPAGRNRLMELVDIVSIAMDNFMEDPDDEVEERTIIMQLHVPAKLHASLKALAAERTNQKSGRPMGLYKYTLTVLHNHAQVATNRPMKSGDPEALFASEPMLDEESLTPTKEKDEGLVPIL